MKLLGTVKGKLIAGTMAVGIVSGTGLALANTDAGENLRNWYEGVFNDRVASAEEEADAYAESLRSGFEEHYEDRKNQQEGIVDRYRVRETNNAVDGITSAKESHLEDLDAAKQEIMTNMEQKFYSEYIEAYFEIIARGEEAKEFVRNDLEAFGTDQEVRMLEQVTNDLTAAKEEAITDLEEAIEAAKQEVSVGVEAGGQVMENNLKNQIDFELEAVKQEVRSILARLEEENKAIIATHAENLEQEAKDALDDVVSGI